MTAKQYFAGDLKASKQLHLVDTGSSIVKIDPMKLEPTFEHESPGFFGG